jgi:predicted DNA-binding transcriptional regulator YafY
MPSVERNHNLVSEGRCRAVKLDRLVSIITMLLRRERVQAKELADLFEVSVRTILRDIDAIDLSGIPIVTYQGAGGGIGIAAGYRLDRSVLTNDEMAALIMGLKGMAASLGDPKLGILLDKLMNTIPAAQIDVINLKASQVVIDMTPWGGNSRLKGALELLRSAIENRREVSFLYVDSDSRKTERHVQPYTLILKGQSWYLYGWCTLRESLRLFKVIRARDIRMLEISFEPMPRDQWPAPPFDSGDDTEYPANLLLAFDAAAENAVLEWFGDADFESAGGRIIVRTWMPENNWLYSFLLSFGPALEVLEPKHIRNILASIAIEVYSKYSDCKSGLHSSYPCDVFPQLL